MALGKRIGVIAALLAFVLLTAGVMSATAQTQGILGKRFFDNWSIGVGAGPGLSQRVLGEVGGVESHALTEAELPGHTHAVPAVSEPAATSTPAGALPAGSRVPTYTTGEATPGGTATTPAGGGQPHSNLSPYLVCSYIIALEGIFPVRA